MIEKFEVGKWYRYTGRERRAQWNHEGRMDYVLDGKPRKCVAVPPWQMPRNAAFEDDKTKHCWSWHSGFELWEEVSLRIKLDTILGESDE